jgi:hypothetical protein
VEPPSEALVIKRRLEDEMERRVLLLRDMTFLCCASSRRRWLGLFVCSEGEASKAESVWSVMTVRMRER